MRRYNPLTLVCGIVLGGLGSIFQLRVKGGWAAGYAGWPLHWYSYTDVGPSHSYNWSLLALDAMAPLLFAVVLCEALEMLFGRRSME